MDILKEFRNTQKPLLLSRINNRVIVEYSPSDLKIIKEYKSASEIQKKYKIKNSQSITRVANIFSKSWRRSIQGHFFMYSDIFKEFLNWNEND
jgi:hypothetical protein